MTESKLITKCCVKNNNIKKPERAIKNFLPIEEVDNPLLIL